LMIVGFTIITNSLIKIRKNIINNKILLESISIAQT